MKIKFKPSLIIIQPKLLAIWNEIISADENVNEEVTQITINFRDSSYSCDEGGYHPVEISMQKDAETDHWGILYITDFSYYGHPYAELVKDLDFDFSTKTFLAAYCQPRGITTQSVKEIYQLWEHNFLSYLEYEAFDQIKVSAW